MCFIGVFYALVEYCIVIVLTKEANWESELKKPQKIQPFEKEMGNKKFKKFLLARKIERISRIILPMYTISSTFVFFSACYLH